MDSLGESLGESTASHDHLMSQYASGGFSDIVVQAIDTPSASML